MISSSLSHSHIYDSPIARSQICSFLGKGEGRLGKQVCFLGSVLPSELKTELVGLQGIKSLFSLKLFLDK